MTVGFIVSVLLASPAPTLVVPDQASSVGQADAAYEQMTTGQTADAIARLEAARERNPNDPSLLINLGTAYFRADRIEEAREAFRQAMASDERYSVELADGRWEDSRKVARMALTWMETTLASR